ncbi:hypothetical protein ES703_115399 [subsurface metagenome]
MYTSISIEAPSSTPAGSRVGVVVKVRNTDSVYMHYIATSVAAPFPGESIIYEEQWIDPRETRNYYATFIMPDEDAGIYAATWRWEYDHWVLDNSRDKTVALEEVPEVYEGTISRKELEYDHVRSSIPVY